MKRNFDKLCEDLKVWEEIEFEYKWLTYWFINWYFDKKWKTFWYFLCNEINLCIEICLFEEKEKLLEFAKNYKINWIYLKEIFDKKLYDD